jgi:hypothetical protein
VDGLYTANYRIKNYCKNVSEEKFDAFSKLQNAVYAEQFYGNFLAHFLLFKKEENQLKIPDLNSEDLKQVIPYVSPYYGHARDGERYLIGLKHHFLGLNEGIELEDLSLPGKYARIFTFIDNRKNLVRLHRRVLPMSWDEFMTVIKTFYDENLIYLHR